MIIEDLKKILELTMNLCETCELKINDVTISGPILDMFISTGHWEATIGRKFEFWLSYDGRLVAHRFDDIDNIRIHTNNELFRSGMYPDMLETINTTLFDNKKDFSKDMKRVMNDIKDNEV